MRLIDADALHKAYMELRNFKQDPQSGDWISLRAVPLTTVIRILNEAPTIEPKRGEWIPCTKSGLALTELMRREGQKWYGYRCSNCNHIYKGNALTDCNFCPNCGANMKGADDDTI